ncbi:MAG TPA: CUAEP/CCAEP-tail radical SAM protein [Blastocatellia bacterium]|jgi:radical SAM superfamily enzyme YgiQ (UPF0313 family)|nr:CUAEP/CCAEP-tail radical SAM protein [Blastocatellia bacterium]
MKEHPKTILLVSCYEMGHQPAGLAVPIGFLERAGYRAEAMDVSVEGFDPGRVARARFVGISVPMHTALRLGLRVAEQVRRINPDCHICFYGLYASLNEDYLLDHAADSVIGGEYEEALVKLVESLDAGEPPEADGVSTRARKAKPRLARLPFPLPVRNRLPSMDRYARLVRGGEELPAGYVEASRGCLHLCTHCPIPPVYGGRFFVVPQDVVLEDIRRLAGSGARHITFGDPDFLNGPLHSLRLARAMHEEFPEITFDFTAKVEHILKHRELLPEFASLGCVFIVSAVESLSDTVLDRLEKGHTRSDIGEALRVLRGAGIALRPSFVSFTPWTSMDDYLDVMEFVEAEGLIDNVDPVQYTIRLLIPPGSLLLERADTERWLGRLIHESFSYEWAHPDPFMDELHGRVSRLVEESVSRKEDPSATFYRIRDLARGGRGDGRAPLRPALPPDRLRPPRLSEAWFC